MVRLTVKYILLVRVRPRNTAGEDGIRTTRLPTSCTDSDSLSPVERICTLMIMPRGTRYMADLGSKPSANKRRRTVRSRPHGNGGLVWCDCCTILIF